jgi:hypothetical protein
MRLPLPISPAGGEDRSEGSRRERGQISLGPAVRISHFSTKPLPAKVGPRLSDYLEEDYGSLDQY